MVGFYPKMGTQVLRIVKLCYIRRVSDEFLKRELGSDCLIVNNSQKRIVSIVKGTL